MSEADHEVVLSGRYRERIGAARGLLVFSGAGLSAESGLGTFRGSDGLWQSFRREELASPEGFARDPARVWDWYLFRYGRMRGAEPNAGHREIASWRGLFPSMEVVTQNIDELHQRAGSEGVVELHGSIHRARCNACGRTEPMERAIERGGSPPRCPLCGGLVRPDVVWFGEYLPQAALARATAAARSADLCVVVGTSAQVYPAAGLAQIAAGSGAFLIEVNPEATPLSPLCQWTLRGPASVELPRLGEAFRRWRSPS